MTFSNAGQMLGLLIVAIGLFSIFARNFFWKIEVFGDRLSGKRSERTPVWDMWQVLRGVLFIVVGLTLLMQARW